MNGNNKSTASRLCYCIHLVAKVIYPSKTQALSTKEVTTSAETKTKFAWLKIEYQKVYRILRRKARIHPEKAVFGGLLVGFHFGIMSYINRKSETEE